MSEVTYDGDSLVSVFEKLQISLGNLNKNVVRAWFDTDDDEVKNFLYFLCSLSEVNCLKAEELLEFKTLEPVHGKELDSSCKLIEEKYPNIFNKLVNSINLRSRTEKLKKLRENEKKLDRILDVENGILENFALEKTNLERRLLQLTDEREMAENRVILVSKDLDEEKQVLHAKLTKEFEILSIYHNPNSEFLTRMDLEHIHDPMEFHRSLQNLLTEQLDIIESYKEETELEILERKLISSKKEFFQKKFEEEELVNNFKEIICTDETSNVDTNKTPRERNEILKLYNETSMRTLGKSKLFLEETVIEELSMNFDQSKSCITPTETSFKNPISSLNVNLKKKENLCEKSRKNWENPKSLQEILQLSLNCTRLKKNTEELQNFEKNRTNILQISNYCRKLSTITTTALALFNQEEDNFKDAIKFFDRVSNLNSNNKSSNMTEILTKHSDYGEKNAMLNSMFEILGTSSLKESFDIVNKLNLNLKEHSQRLFQCPSLDLNSIFESVALKFLSSKETNRLLVVPPQLRKCFLSVRSNLEKQNGTIKHLLKLNSTTVQYLEQCEERKMSRLIWMYFLISPEKLTELDEKFKSKVINAIKFKE